MDRLRATIRHEVGHVPGLLHEQQRWDRSGYLDLEGSGGGKGSTSFDCYSIMLYRGIKLKDGACSYHHGYRDKEETIKVTADNQHISSGDIAAVRRMY